MVQIKISKHKTKNQLFASMVPEAGLEPARYFYRGILSPLCLPIPPLGLKTVIKTHYIPIMKIIIYKLEAESGIEPE